MIERGELKAGDPLPSESYLQQEHGSHGELCARRSACFASEVS